MSAREPSRTSSPSTPSTCQRSRSPTPTNSDDNYFFAGLVSSFPDITPNAVTAQLDIAAAGTPLEKDSPQNPPCKVFQTIVQETRRVSNPETRAPDHLPTQVLVFRYRGKVHAIDHRCPHFQYPLSRGKLHDIEDSGIVHSAGITCPRHGWDFDIFTGKADRGRYRLRIWDVQLRERNGDCKGEDETDDTEKEVWVKRRGNKEPVS